MNRHLRRALIVVAALAGFTELLARLSGVADYPTYDLSADYGYLPQPNQQGRFLHRNFWIFNERSMATGPYRPELKENILLIGDSIVLGGNPVDQSERWAGQLEDRGRGRWSVWPVGAASWSNLNEIAWIKKNRDVDQSCRWIVWEINSGDFYEFSHWAREEMQPRHHPASVAWYALQKYVWDRWSAPPYLYWLKHPSDFPAYPTNMIATLPDFENFVAHWPKGPSEPRILIVWYPAKLELHGQAPGWNAMSRMMEQICERQGLELLDVSRETAWNESLYRDHLHPTAAGYRRLAEWVAERLNPGGAP